MFAKCYWRAWSRSVRRDAIRRSWRQSEICHCKKEVRRTLYSKTKRTNRKRPVQCEDSKDRRVGHLRKLAESCNFGIQEDSIIRDQLVRGMLPDKKLKDKLYEEDNLNLEKAIKIITTHEIRSTMTSAASVDAVYHQGRGRGMSRGSSCGRGSSRGSNRGCGQVVCEAVDAVVAKK